MAADKITNQRLQEIAGTLPAFIWETTAMAQELLELRKDKERLDWCAKMAAKYPGEVRNVIGQNMRAAIDAAMEVE